MRYFFSSLVLCLIALSPLNAKNAGFSSQALSKTQIISLEKSGAWNPMCPVQVNRLRVVTVYNDPRKLDRYIREM